MLLTFYKTCKCSDLFYSANFWEYFYSFLVTCCALFCYDDFFAGGVSVVIENKEVDAALLASQMVTVATLRHGVEAKSVDGLAEHVVNRHAHPALRFAET